MNKLEALQTLNPKIITLRGDKAEDQEGNEVAYDKNELNAELAKWQYQDERKKKYPSIEEQLDMQYWDQVNGTTKWKEAIAKVKSDNPKPE